MRTTLLIAFRYLFSRRSHSVVNIISGVSLLSLMLPVAALILLLSIFNGFGGVVASINAASEADLTIRLKRGKLFDRRELRAEVIESIEGVQALSMVNEQTLVVEHDGRAEVVVIRGVDPNYSSVVDIESFIGVGNFDIANQDGVVLCGYTPRSLGISQLNGTMLKLYTLRTGGLQSYIPMATYRSVDAPLIGVAYIDSEHDQRYGYTSNSLMDRLLSRDSVATRGVVKLKTKADQPMVKRAVSEVAGDQFEVLSREELNSALFEVVRYEKYGIMVIAILVMLLASFSLVGAVTMVVVERREDISTLSVMGMTQRDLKRLFTTLGSIISAIGIIGGLTVGIVLAMVQQHFEIIKLPITSAVTIAYPVDVQIGDILYLILLSGGVSYLLSRGVVELLLTHKAKN